MFVNRYHPYRFDLYISCTHYDSTINFYKSESAGNHVLFYVGSSLSGAEIVSNCKYSATRVFLAKGKEPPENDDIIVTVVS